VKPVHALRCTVYSWDICLWMAVVALAANAIRAVHMVFSKPGNARILYYTTPYVEPILQDWLWILVGVPEFWGKR
jgi:hypothetical protein